MLCKRGKEEAGGEETPLPFRGPALSLPPGRRTGGREREDAPSFPLLYKDPLAGKGKEGSCFEEAKGLEKEVRDDFKSELWLFSKRILIQGGKLEPSLRPSLFFFAKRALFFINKIEKEELFSFSANRK